MQVVNFVDAPFRKEEIIYDSLILFAKLKRCEDGTRGGKIHSATLTRGSFNGYQWKSVR